MAMLTSCQRAAVVRRIPARVATSALFRGCTRRSPVLQATAPSWRSLASVATPQTKVSSASWPLQRRSFASAGDVVEEKVPGFGAESITEGTILEIKKASGDGVTKGEVICIIETDKVTVEVNAAESGTVQEVLAKVDDTVEVGASLLKIVVGDAPAAGAAAPAAAAPAAASAAAPAPAAVLSEPATGFRAGLLRAKAIREGKLPAASSPAPAESAAPSPSPQTPEIPAATGRGDRRVPMSLVRKLVATRLKDTQTTAALLSTFQEVDMSAALALCSKYKDLFEKTHGTQLGFLSLFVKASAAALEELPGVNAVIDDGTSEIVYRDYSDVSVPIPSPRGIVSCTIQNANEKSLKDVELEIADLMTKARSDSLTLDDMVTPTFGITDTGSAGGMLGTAVISPPMSAIMGTNAVTQRAAIVNGKVMARPYMYLSLTYDHRLVDGREGVTFLVSVRDKMEDPVRMFLDL